MPGLPEFQKKFADALRSGNCDHLQPLISESGDAFKKRFAVYRNNVFHSLIVALRDAFPAVEKLTGPDLFAPMAAAWLRDNFPEQGSLIGFGQNFPEFIAAYKPADSAPWLADLARLEHACTTARNAPDAPPLKPEHLAATPADRYPDLTLTPHPSLQFVAADWPVHRLRDAVHADSPIPDMAPKTTRLIVLRPRWSVAVLPVSAGNWALVQEFANNATLHQAALAAQNADPEFDLQETLTRMIAAGAFAAPDSTPDSSDCQEKPSS